MLQCVGDALLDRGTRAPDQAAERLAVVKQGPFGSIGVSIGEEFGKWNSSTLNGSRSRANGVLQNPQYIGEIVWNRQRFIKNPATSKRVSRLNPESEWQRGEAPHLAIVDRTVFGLSVARKVERSADRGTVVAKARHILSGLTKCGCCGASCTVIGAGRIGCSGNRERGDCGNNRTVTRAHIADRVLAALDGYLADPEMIAAYVAQYSLCGAIP